MSDSPPCRVCKRNDEVICYPNEHSLTICPTCCAKAEHPDGETGHQWRYNPHERGSECDYCGILRRCTEEAYSE